MRILPRTNEDVNEEWISDKTRHVVDGLRTQRLDQPYVRVDGRLRPATWKEAFATIASKVKRRQRQAHRRDRRRARRCRGNVCAQVADDSAWHRTISTPRYPGSPLHPKLGRASYLFNSTIAGIDEADAIMLIVHQSAQRSGGAQCPHPQALAQGQCPDRRRSAKRPISPIPTTISAPGRKASRSSSSMRRRKKEKPMFIIGQGALNAPTARPCSRWRRRLRPSLGVVKDGWNGFNILHTEAALRRRARSRLRAGRGRPRHRRHAGKAGALDVLFLLGVDEVEVPPGAFVVYIGTHGDRGAHRADVILPGAAYPEKSGIYVNTEGRVQMANRAAFPPGDAREDWAILRALSDVLGHKLPYDSLGAAASGAVYGASASGAHRPDCRRQCRRHRQARQLGGEPDKAPLRSCVERFLSHQPDRARFRDHGRMFGAGARGGQTTAAE